MFIDVGEIRKSPDKSFHFELAEKVQPIVVGNDEISFEAPIKVSR